MREIDVVYLYEHAARELDVACAVTARLRRAGFSVEIVHWPTGFPVAVRRVRPRLVVLPFCYTEDSYEALLAYWRESLFFNMTWEQLFYIGNRKAKTPRGDFVTQHVIHHAWSEAYASFLAANGIPTNRIFMNGQPAFTLYTNPYRKYFASRAELADRHGLDPSRRWVFFPENYNWAFYSPETLAQFIAGGQSTAEVQEMREFCEFSLAAVLEWCANLVERHHLELILRPRPSTTQEQVHGFISATLSVLPQHLHVIQKESVREWVLASDVVVSSHSTTLIEAAIAGKCAFILEPRPIPAALHVDWHDLLPHLKTEAEMIAECVRTNDWMPDQRLADWAQASFMSRGDSIRNLAQHLASILNGELQVPAHASRETATPGLGWTPPSFVWSVYRRGKQWIRHPGTRGIEHEYVKDALPAPEIESNIAKWSHLLEAQA